jgi:flagellar biosynthesis/type III secretory pathway M-ring protein FliF/YscJ
MISGRVQHVVRARPEVAAKLIRTMLMEEAA